MGNDYDLIVVGGGLAGATLARSLAGKGADVLVLERAPERRPATWMRSGSGATPTLPSQIFSQALRA